MLDTLAQYYSSSSQLDSSTNSALIIVAVLIVMPIVIFMLVCMWKVFVKAGVEGWKALIPIYNGWTLAEIAGKPGWWGIISYLGFIPILGYVASVAGIVLGILIGIELAKAFGKDKTFGVLALGIFSFVGYAILAFSDVKYTKPPTAPATPKPPTPVSPVGA